MSESPPPSLSIEPPPAGKQASANGSSNEPTPGKSSAPKRQKTLSRFLTPTRKSEKVVPHEPSPILHATIKISDTLSVKAEVTWDGSTQHTLTWAQPIKLPVSVDGKPATLMPGNCNLYSYPKVFFDHLRKGKGVVPPAEQLYVLEELLSALLLDTDEDEGLAFRRDWSGSTPLMGLLVANTTASLQLSISVYRAAPNLIKQFHVAKHGIFNGENGLHILAVNSRETELCEVVELAAAALTTDELQGIFWRQAEGHFFQDAPMSFYGSTATSFAVAFSLTSALRTMLRCSKQYPQMRGVIDFNSTQQACRMTGFLPIHVAVANSLTGMVNFLLDLPGMSIEYDDLRANPQAFSACGKRSMYSLLNPLQVACKLGDRKLVQYILRTQSKMQWSWGPVSSYHLDLAGIDSMGDTANDVMELVSRLDALKATKEMLLDEFMNGLLHTLFEAKYNKACKYIHYTMRIIDALYLLSMYALGFWMKEYPSEVVSPTTIISAILPYITLGSIVPLAFEDVRSSLAWWNSARGGPRDEESRKLLKEGGLAGTFAVGGRDIGTLLKWMQSHGMFTRFLGWGCAIWAELWLMGLRTRAPLDPSWPPSAITARDRLDVLLAPLSIACFLHTGAFFDALLFPFKKVGVLYKAVFMMLYKDVSSWTVLFMIFLMNYGMVMYFVYPHMAYAPDEDFISMTYAQAPAAYKDTDTEPAPRFLNVVSALQSLIDLAFIGEPLELDMLAFAPPDSEHRTITKSVLFFVFILYYYFYVLMSLILLLNLLIAMMSESFVKAIEEGDLLWRVDFARRVLRMELQLKIFHDCGLLSLNCGEKVGTGKDAKWVREYKSYRANSEGGGTGGNRSMFDADVEEEAEEDEKDDDGPGALGEAPSATPAIVRMNTLAEMEKAKSGRISKRAMLEKELDTKGKLDGGSDKMRVVGAALAMVTLHTPRGGALKDHAPAAAKGAPPPPASPPPGTEDVDDLLQEIGSQ